MQLMLREIISEICAVHGQVGPLVRLCIYVWVGGHRLCFLVGWCSWLNSTTGQGCGLRNTVAPDWVGTQAVLFQLDGATKNHVQAMPQSELGVGQTLKLLSVI